jgi:hypothetical protein
LSRRTHSGSRVMTFSALEWLQRRYRPYMARLYRPPLVRPLSPLLGRSSDMPLLRAHRSKVHADRPARWTEPWQRPLSELRRERHTRELGESETRRYGVRRRQPDLHLCLRTTQGPATTPINLAPPSSSIREVRPSRRCLFVGEVAARACARGRGKSMGRPREYFASHHAIRVQAEQMEQLLA